MSKRERINLFKRHIAEAQTEKAKIQAKMASSTLALDSPEWAALRIRLEHWDRVEREYRARLERLLRERD